MLPKHFPEWDIQRDGLHILLCNEVPFRPGCANLRSEDSRALERDFLSMNGAYICDICRKQLHD